MRFSDLKDLTPAQVPVAKVDFRGEKVDIFRIVADDLFFLLNKSPEVVSAWDADGDDEAGTAKLLTAIGQAGPEVLNRLLASGLRATVEEVKAENLDIEEQLEILTKILQEGIPSGFLKRLMAMFGGVMSKQGIDLSNLSVESQE